MATKTRALRRVGFNLLYLVPGEVGGSEVVARRLLRAIRALEPDLELIAYASRRAIEALADEDWAPSVEFVASPVDSRSKPLRIAAELTWLPSRLRRDRVQLLHSLGTTAPPFSPVPSVVTVLDLIYEHFPQTFPWASRVGLKLLVPLGVRRAQRIVAISKAGKRDLVSTLHVDPGRIDVVPLGLGTRGLPNPVREVELRARYGIGPGPLVLTVSSALQHKNLRRLLDALARLASVPQATLAVVGHAGREQDALREHAATLGIEERVVFTGWVDGQTLEGFYAAATVFAYPSLMEGFGLPLLEAMRRGVPIACSNCSALPEVAGGAAEYFDPYDVSAIASAITRLLDDPARRRELVDLGERRYPSFSWERTAQATLAIYRDLVEARSTRRTSDQ